MNGIEVKGHNNSFYENIGVDFEFSSLYEKLTAKENLAFFGSLYSQPLRSADELLHLAHLENDGNNRVSAYSKGMKSRLNFSQGLCVAPPPHQKLAGLKKPPYRGLFYIC